MAVSIFILYKLAQEIPLIKIHTVLSCGILDLIIPLSMNVLHLAGTDSPANISLYFNSVCLD